MTRYIHMVVFFMLFALGNTTLMAQGQTKKDKGHYLAGLDFFGNWGNNTIPHGNPAQNGLYAADGWVSGTSNGKTVKMKGLMNAAVLKLDWTTLVGEPIENYQFVWKSSGQYEIQYTNSKGQPKLQTISRSQLEKYPDLLKRFDNLAPSNIDFVIEWRIGDQSDADREAYLKKYNLMGSIGSSHPHVKAGFKTTVKGSGLLFEPTGKQPYNVPSSPQYGWTQFLGLPREYDKTKLTHIKDYFKMCYGQVITNFKAIKVDWNWGELTAIAEKYDSYEKGETEPTPKEQIEKENQKAVAAYTKNDEWSEAYEKENEELILVEDANDVWKQGAKNKKGEIVIPIEKGRLENLSKEYGIIIRHLGNGFTTIKIYNSKGKIIDSFNGAYKQNPLNKTPFIFYAESYGNCIMKIKDTRNNKIVFSTDEIITNTSADILTISIVNGELVGEETSSCSGGFGYAGEVTGNNKYAKIKNEFYSGLSNKYSAIYSFKASSGSTRPVHYYGITKDNKWEFIKTVNY